MSSDFGLTPDLVAFIKRHEGWVAEPYRCPAGFPTIGYGHRIPSMACAPISRDEGERLLVTDLRIARDGVLRWSPNVTDERRLAALVDFVFNLGEGRYQRSTLLKRVKEEKWPEAAKEMRRWVYADGRVHAGLVARRREMARWLEEGTVA